MNNEKETAVEESKNPNYKKPNDRVIEIAKNIFNGGVCSVKKPQADCMDVFSGARKIESYHQAKISELWKKVEEMNFVRHLDGNIYVDRDEVLQILKG